MRLSLVTCLTILACWAGLSEGGNVYGQTDATRNSKQSSDVAVGPRWPTTISDDGSWLIEDSSDAEEPSSPPASETLRDDNYIALAIKPDDDPQPETEDMPLPVESMPSDGEELPYYEEDDAEAHGDDCHDDGFYTTGAPFPGDGGVFFNFPAEPRSPCEDAVTFGPDLLTGPHNMIGNFWARVFCIERDRVHSALDDEPLDIQFIPPRPPLIVEWNELFLGPGPLAHGRELGPLGPVWRPAYWVWGEFRTATQYFDNGSTTPVFEWANRLDLFAQLNLSGTERFLFAVRPLDRENAAGTAREFASYDFLDGDWLPGLNFQPQTAFFEGDFGELFPLLDPYDSKFIDYGFSVGRMPLLAQQGLLINEDRIDAVTVTRNTLNHGRNLNMRITGFYAWNEINRNSSVAPNPATRISNESNMVGLLTETDFYRSTVNADVVFVGGDSVDGDLLVYGISGIQRHYFLHNTFNTSLHFLSSQPTGAATPYAGQGELLFAQTSWTPHHYLDLIYVNAFLAIDQFTSPARQPLAGSPLGLTGIGYSGAGVGRFGAPYGARANDVIGGALGYQWFFTETRKQIVWEFGGSKDHAGPGNRGVIGSLIRYQAAHGQHAIFVVEASVDRPEGADTGAGGRAEIRLKF